MVIGMSYKYLINDLSKVFAFGEYDFMGNHFNQKSELTFHHIIKKENGGLDDITNGAALTDYSHKILHIIEVYDKDLYDTYTKIFKIINETGYISKRMLVILNILNEYVNEDIEKFKLEQKYNYLRKKQRWNQKSKNKKRK